VVARLRAASGAGGAGPRLEYAFDIGASVRGIVLDTVRRDHGSRGVLPTEEAAWLRAQLARAGRRWVLVFSHQPLTSFPDGARALALLDRDPHVLATAAGDTHHNQIRARRTPAGGYWTITTSSLADYPQQARAFRLVQGAHGNVALETWMVDASGDPLADTARELAYLDVQGGRPNGFAGRRVDRNVRLWR
jgi:hypothetical protein